MAHCEQLALCGYEWELPNRDQLFTLLGGCDSQVLEGISGGYCYACNDPASPCNSVFPSPLLETGANATWAADIVQEGDTAITWLVYMYDGAVTRHALPIPSTADRAARCVRAGR